MVIVLKISGFPVDATTRDLKELFRGLRVREEDLHIGYDKGSPVGFAVFSDDDAARRATTRSGQNVGPKRVRIMLSSSAEMDSMLSRRPISRGSRGSPPRFARGGGFSSPSFRGRGRGRGGAFVPDRFHDRSDRDFDSRPGRPSRADRAPVVPDFKTSRGGKTRGSGLDELGKRPGGRSESEEFSERKFIKLSGLPYSVTDLDVQNFFKGILTREVFVFKHQEGRFVGRPNGDAVVEFFSEQDAREALERDGRRMGPRIVFVSRPRRDEIKDAMRNHRPVGGERRPEKTERRTSHETMQDIIPSSMPKNKEELSNLFHLFKTMVAAMGSNEPEPEPKPRHRRESVEDPVIRRVARNANINIRDIGEAKVVGIRNLPFSVTPEEVISFFRGYAAVPDSVRIHYSEDGRSSGDAIITFRSTRDAEKAVGELNRKTVGKRRVELFIM